MDYVHHYERMETISRAYLGKSKCSLQEVVYCILPEFKLRTIFPTNYFDNIDILGERKETFLFEMELKELLGDRSHIFKKSNIDGFIDIPNALFNSGK